MRPGPQAAALPSVVRDLLTTRDGAAGGDRPDPAALRRAARRWFGEPAA
ncbi:hypothetical protein ATL51_1218 [Pseudonocardia alni]|jgi:hypothetical protein|uniref:Uncharacterized protein n=2 Tax=Pseudonocardia alni TaxID=33907 RepID=A0AA44ZN58_PSEA5|nr:hypothetical protein ATL51_1218 [Pseudonocardia alni]